MNIFIINRQRRIRIPVANMKRLAGLFMKKAAAMNPRVRWVECSVVIVGHREMTGLNERILRHTGTTDVITFSYATAPGEEPAGRRGEIVINAEEAAAVAKLRRIPVFRELALYLAHGCQHLGGADDATPRQRAAMNRRQNRWLRSAFTPSKDRAT